MCDLARTHWCMQVEVFLEVATLDISMPLAVALDGGAAVFPTSTVVDLLPEVHRLVGSHRRAVPHRRARTWQHRGRLRHEWRTRRCRKVRLLHRGLAPPLMVWCVDSGNDELVNVVMPLLGH
jgi:hypothetical protein